jgi:thiol:disulfide interchange protein DsbA|tara:strand:+ start:1038 stop:1673 length:636 start_codon:yes stop_codon:yes gene_type:complete
MFKKILFLFVVSTTLAFSNEKFVEGVDYETMTNEPSSYVQKQNKKIQVVEAFWYGCPHCYIFDEYLSKWDKKNDEDLEFVNMPVVFNKPWLLHARVFYTFKEMDNYSELHKNFFYAFHEQQRKFNTMDSIMNFFESQNVDIEQAKKILLSEKVSKKVQEANYMLETYKIDSVPAIIINNKYKISGSMAKTYDRMIEISEYIIDLERKNRAK